MGINFFLSTVYTDISIMPTEQYDQATRLRAIQELGVTMPGDLLLVQRAPFPQAKMVLEELKTRVKKNYRRLIAQYHPDRTGGDEAKTAWFKVLTHVSEEFYKLEVHPPPPPMLQIQTVRVMPMHGIHVQVVPNVGTNATSSPVWPGFVTIRFR